jgi:predicted PurR-regulated permease PerM
MNVAGRPMRTYKPASVSLGILVLWGALALASPGRTYHFAPLFAAAAWPATLRVLRGRLDGRAGLRAAASGVVITVLAAIALHALGALAGPSLIGGSALVESSIAAVGGASWGARIATRRRPGVFVSNISTTGRRSDPPSCNATRSTSSEG